MWRDRGDCLKSQVLQGPSGRLWTDSPSTTLEGLSFESLKIKFQPQTVVLPGRII